MLFYESSDEEDEIGKVGSVSLVSIEIKCLLFCFVWDFLGLD